MPAAVADALGMERILIHPLAGVLSAYGIGIADVKAIRETSWLKPLGEDFSAALASSKRRARDALVEQGVRRRPDRARTAARGCARRAATRRSRSRSRRPSRCARRSPTLHRRRFGYSDEGAEVDRRCAGGRGGRHDPPAEARGGGPIARADGRMAPGEVIAGPALIFDPTSTIVVEPGWRAERGERRHARSSPAPSRSNAPRRSAPTSIRSGSRSSTICSWPSPRRWASRCSRPRPASTSRSGSISPARSSTRDGALIANAPHIPVHLGSMGESIRTIIDTRGEGRDGRGIRRGDAYVLNDPYRGGTHLPDITVIVPVFYGDEAEPSAFVAARGHHADIGGIAPGSMPPDSRTIDEEGVLIDNELLVDEGHFREAEMRALLGVGRMAGAQSRPQHLRPQGPARRLHARRRSAGADRARLRRRRSSPPTWATSSPMPRNRCGGCSTGSTTASSTMRWTMARTSASRSRIDKAARSATFDFTGTSDQLPDNFNAPFSIVRAASLYVVRTLIDDAIPMNDGCLRPIELIVPEGSMLNPRYPGRGRRRQCRDQPGRHRRLVRRDRPARAEPGDDEQFHLRQRAAPIL